jgi:hypothetical protein
VNITSELDYESLFISDVISHIHSENLREYRFAQNLYAALCNTDWVYRGKPFSVSWRGSGRIVSEIRNKLFLHSEDYLSFYCSGISCDYDDRPEERGFLPEGRVSEEIKEFLKQIDCVEP